MFKKITALLFLGLILTGCQSASSPDADKKQEAEQPQKNMSEQPRILMVIAPQDFRDEEFNEPHEIFTNNNYKVDVASIQPGTATGVQGTEVEIDLTVGQVNVEDYRAVMFVGGPGMGKIVTDDSLQVLAQKFHKNDKLTTAICIAPAILAHAGILKDKKATSFPGAREAVENNGAEFTGETVTVDGNIITGNGPEAASEFAHTVVKNLN